MFYNPILRVNKYIHMCHICTMQALAWVRVALLRGLACLVASTWVPRENKPPFYCFLIVLNDLNSKINSKNLEKSLKIRKIHNFQNITPN